MLAFSYYLFCGSHTSPLILTFIILFLLEIEKVIHAELGSSNKFQMDLKINHVTPNNIRANYFNPFYITCRPLCQRKKKYPNDVQNLYIKLNYYVSTRKRIIRKINRVSIAKLININHLAFYKAAKVTKNGNNREHQSK